MPLIFLKTDHGAHPPEKWALATAHNLVLIAPNSDMLIQRAASELQFKVADALVKHYRNLQEAEAGALALHGDDHLATPIDPLPYVDAALADVVAAAKGTSWEEKFKSTERREHEFNVFLAPGEEPLPPYPSVQDVMKSLIASYFAGAIHNARSWHADKHPEGPNAIAFKKAHHPGPTPNPVN
jgi:hypothetical protein